MAETSGASNDAAQAKEVICLLPASRHSGWVHPGRASRARPGVLVLAASLEGVVEVVVGDLAAEHRTGLDREGVAGAVGIPVRVGLCVAAEVRELHLLQRARVVAPFSLANAERGH